MSFDYSNCFKLVCAVSLIGSTRQSDSLRGFLTRFLFIVSSIVTSRSHVLETKALLDVEAYMVQVELD